MPSTLLAAALGAQSAGVFVAERVRTGSGLRIIFVNDSFIAMTGHAAATLVGSDFAALHVERNEIRRIKKWLPRAKPGQSLTGEGYLARADDGAVAVGWSLDPLRNARGRVTHIIGTYRDQTDKRQLQETLVHAQRLDAVGRLAGGVAHDFNNLLSVINGYCEILAGEVADHPKALRQIGEIHNAGRKAAALTQQLLAFSRRQPLNAHVIDLNRLIEANAPILQRLIGEAGKLQLQLGRNTANVRTDESQFQQVLMNLVLNARDALREKGQIVVSTANRTILPQLNRRATDLPPGPYVVLSVADNGTGMDADTMKRLFEPFFTTKPEGKGTGLGLALAYGVVQQSGGTILATSELLVGSRFEVLLPAAAGPAEEPAPPEVPALPALRGHETVWFLEPDDVVRKMVAGMLTADGYRVTAFTSGAEAPKDPAVLRTIELFIGSMHGEGEKLARRILVERKDLRVLVIDEQSGEPDVAWLESKRQMHLPKPYALSTLLRTARNLLDA